MSSPTPQQSNDTRLAEAQLRKVEAEIEALEWQNSVKGQIVKHLGTLSLLATTLATIIAITMNVVSYLDSQRKDRELREQELIEKLGNSYSTKLESLLAFGQDNSLTSNLAVLKLKQIGNLLKNWPQLDESARKEKNQEIANTLAEVFKSGQVDFRRIKDVEFDIGAIDTLPGYLELLEQDKGYNPHIIYKYVKAVNDLHLRAPASVESATLKTDGSIESDQFKDFQDALLFEKLTLGFRKHIEALKKSQAKNSDPDSQNQLLLAFRSYCQATKNRKLTLAIFGDDKIYVNEMLGCN